MSSRSDRDRRDEGDELFERVVHITRVAKVVQGGRRFGFRVVVAVGDQNGKVGVGIGKARDVPQAIRKGAERARASMVSVNLMGTTVPHDLLAEHGAAKVLIKPAAIGTGVIAGGGARAVLEAAGVKDVLSKSLGSANILNVVMATWKGLQQMRDRESAAAARGKTVAELAPPWRTAANDN